MPRPTDPAGHAEGGRQPIRVIMPQVPLTRVLPVGSVPRVVYVGAQHFDRHGIRARHLRVILHRYELAFVAVKSIHLCRYQRVGDREGAFGPAFPEHGWLEPRADVLAWIRDGVPEVPPNWPPLDTESEEEQVPS